MESEILSLHYSEPAPLQNITATCTDAEGNTSEFSAPFTITGIEDEKNKIPTEYLLNQSYPNPFNPSTKISWQSPVRSRQVLKIFDVIGNEIATLVDEEKEAGYHSIDFNGSDLPSGVYFYQLRAGSFVQTKQMLLLK